ncbi:MAG: hypothetical protein U0Q16_34710 [Bryobacteraceae bacterium]
MKHARAILWAQWRALFNFYSRGNGASLAITAIGTVGWYGLVLLGALGTGAIASSAKPEMLAHFGPQLLIFGFIFWQIVPIFLTSTGVGLDLKRLVVYPVTSSQLFALEVLLRFSTGMEMVVVLAGAAAGLLLNRAVPVWGPLAFIPWLGFNLFMAAGVRDLLGRILARRGLREIGALVFVLLAALPQVFLFSGVPTPLRNLAVAAGSFPWPWNLTSRIALGQGTALDAVAMLAWTAGALAFGWWQFQRGLRFDADAARSSSASRQRSLGVVEWLYCLPGRLLPDPIGVLVEKELRFLSRAPRFRVVFVMGFSFGLLIWLPLTFNGSGLRFLTGNFLTFVTVYALMLLGEVTVWNSFGFDRSASQIYFLAPVRIAHVLIAKNIAALVFVLLEIAAVAATCRLFRMPLSLQSVAESFLVALVFTVQLMAMGNLSTIYYPRPVNPSQSWRSAAAGRVQALLTMLYPVLSIPIAMAYLARFAFDSQWMFYGVLGVAAVFAAIVYAVSLESSVDAADQRKEQIVRALSEGEGPVTV